MMQYLYILLDINILISYEIVNGGWGEWSLWTDCPVSCDGGTQERSRVCNSPEPEFGGDDCALDGSSDLETQACNENACARK